ncbi:MAG: hydrogen gas-evolving membrane-bound hydrogenase subunit E, partial [Microthrixaceae bacterium]
LLICALAPTAGVVWLATIGYDTFGGADPTETLTWVPQLGLTLSLQLDPLGWVMGMLVCSVGVAVFVYASRYLADGPAASRLGGLLVLFGASMLGLVWSDQILGLFVFWEATTIVSFLLGGSNDESADARAAAWQALLVTGGGGLALLFGLVTVGIISGEWSIQALSDAPPAQGAALAAAGIGVLGGAFTKSAQVPFHGWLLGAMAAPTPVSAYLHSATMVTAGVWVVIRLDPIFSGLDFWYPTMLAFGGATAIWGAWRALSATDLKRLLAFSTISALGVMFALVGVGTPKALFAALAVLVAHGLYKAPSFMGVGIIDHQCGSRDLREIGGLWTALPKVGALMGVAVLSMAAVPATAGFVSKEAGVVASLDATGISGPIGVAVLVLAGLLAVAYGWRMFAGAFLGPRPDGLEPTPPAAAMWVPAALLAATGILFGLVAPIWSDWIAQAAGAVNPKAGVYELLAWPGIGLALGISLATLALGAALAALLQKRDIPPAAEPAFRFDELLAALFRFANRTTRVIQPGSLAVYVGVILVTSVVPGAVVLSGASLAPEGAALAADGAQLVAVAIVLAAAAFVALLRTRLAAVVALGVVGYGVAVLFWVQGAPDLALTQALVETVIVAAFVLVFRRLPEQFRAAPGGRLPAAARIFVSAAVGASVLVMVLATAGQRRPTAPPTERLIETADPVGGGKNVVNVVLTDVRALDTLGEITVVAVAAIGALALSGLTRRRLGATRYEAGPRSRGEERSSPTSEPAPERSVVLDSLLRALFPLIATFSLFMLVAGHNAPGGGFIAGLIAAAAIALRLLTGDWVLPTDRPRWLQPQPLIGFGLAIAVGTLVVVGWIGNGFGDQQLWTTDLPVFGSVKFTSALVFDIGVYAVVLGSAVAILDALAVRTGPRPANDDESVLTGSEL